VSVASDDNVVVRVTGLSKAFTIYHKPRDVLARLFSRRIALQEFSALREVSFELRRGEVLGLIGRNGAGKSTLLKILAGTLTPSGGTVEVTGRVSAVLELGTGFHPDFSGRENIYLGGLCLGMTRAEIDSRIDEIIDFSELRDAIDQPFKTYSTGMQARLTFSTVVSVEPDVLIVDEALSVGDARFQLKSFGKFQEFRRNGKTIILVSHNMNTITGFCDRALLLEKGEVLLDSNPSAVSTFYHKLLFGEQSQALTIKTPGQPQPISERADIDDIQSRESELPEISDTDSEREYRFGTKAAEIIDFAFLDDAGKRTTLLTSGGRYRCMMRIIAHKPIPLGLCAGFLIRSTQGVDLFGTDTDRAEGAPDLPLAQPGDVAEVTVDLAMWLAPGDYFMTFAVARRDGLKLDCRFDALQFQVVGASRLYTTSIVNLCPVFTIERVSARPRLATPVW
jgi:homopolymeric O-antigen transport system ATP-binding protein